VHQIIRLEPLLSHLDLSLSLGESLTLPLLYLLPVLFESLPHMLHREVTSALAHLLAHFIYVLP